MFDFRKRCVVRHNGYDRIFYGLTVDSYVTAGLDGVPENEPTDFAQLSRGGRRPGQPAAYAKHFFNKRIMTDDERIGGLRRSRLRGALTIAQAAISVVLLVGAGLFVRSLWNASTLDLGVDADRVVVAEVSRPSVSAGDGPIRDAERGRR